MGVAEDLKADLPVAMTMAAFMGVAWYLCVELNIRLWFAFLRKRGLYFWACCVASWGVLTQPLFMVLVDFDQVTNPYAGLTLIYISWFIMVIPQSVVLYSRLHLVIANPDLHRYVLYMICFTTICIAPPTMGLGIASQGSGDPRLMAANKVWDKVQVTIFFVQETIISILYIIETRRVLENRATLGETDKSVRNVMHHLIYTNILVVCLDIALLGLSYSHFFYVQSAFKPCVYGVKLRVEFSILNRLVQSVRGGSSYNSHSRSAKDNGGSKKEGESRWRSTPRHDVRLETYSNTSEVNIVPPSVHRSSSPTSSLKLEPYGKDGILQTTQISVTQNKRDDEEKRV
ncbi:uncharacterized protein BDZ99DRAFT_577720 [Mytilinidion resinicola]|uniref:DUF7703 domain-containing protein n=1 Tax=Mytilinidion resinicola TaxID=574789 RepID=A0A6A6XXJ6_9PEZI|nr:uncharacterized protein BDZ99DRAFT_577720 [Mytilinidion resinicola]KAF2801261.1 hypothetical protein BDZ99DRAFT_577720 [Mytilinidion resinicola]